MHQQTIPAAVRDRARRDTAPFPQRAITPHVADGRPGVVALRKLSDVMHESPRMAAQRALAETMRGGELSTVQTSDAANALIAFSREGRAVQRVRTNPSRNAPRTTWSLLRERMSAGLDLKSVLGGVATTGVATLMGLNPLGWGLAAGVAGTALLSYLRGPGNTERDFDRRMELNNYTEDTDLDWTPNDVGRRHIERAQRHETYYPLETASHDWEGKSQRLDTGSGMITFHKGRGNQPYIRTRATEFGGVSVGDDYDSLVNILSDDNPEVEEERAFKLLQMSYGEQVDVRQEIQQGAAGYDVLAGHDSGRGGKPSAELGIGGLGAGLL